MKAYLLATLVTMTALAGCVTSPTPPPILVFEDIRYWFEDELLVVNFTLYNQGNATPFLPMIDVTVSHYASDPDSYTRPGTGYRDLAVWNGLFMFFHHERGELPHRVYDRKAVETYGFPREPVRLGPIEFHPGDRQIFEFVFLPSEWFNNTDGYYTIEFQSISSHPVGEQRIQSGCFNHEYPEFYGVREDGPDCIYYNQDRDRTSTGEALRGPQGLGKPIMQHDPPANVEGAH